MATILQHVDQLIPFEKLQAALKRFCASVELGCIVVDPAGEVLLEEEWHCFCKMHQTQPLPNFRSCIEVAHFFDGKLTPAEQSIVFTCHNGFSCGGAPIVVNGAHIASVFIGLFFVETPHEGRDGHFPARLSELGIDELIYADTCTRIPVYSAQRLRQTIGQLELIVDLLAEMARNVLLEREANQQLRQSERRYRNMVNSLPQAVYETDPRGRITFANQAAFAFFGYTAEDLEQGLDISCAVPAHDHQKITARFQRVLAGEILDPEEYVFKRKDGSVFPALAVSRPIDEGAAIQGVRGIVIDITRRKQAEEHLRRSEAKLQSLFQAVPVGLALLKDRVFQSVNERFCEITGYQTAELLHRTSRFLYESEQEFNRVGAELYSDLHERGTNYTESSFRHRDGSIRTVALFAAPLDPLNPAEGAAVAIQDITEQKETIQALQSSEERFRKTAEFTGQLIYDHNLQTGEIFWSGRITEITGYLLEEMNTHGFAGWAERVHPEDRNDALIGLDQALHQRMPFAAEYRFRKADGSYIHVREEGAYVYDGQGNATRMLGTIKDVTAQKQAADALRRSEERLSIAIRATSDAIWEWNLDNDSTYFSPRWYEMLGYDDQQFPMTLGTYAKLCHPADYQTTMNICHQVLASPLDPDYSAEFRMRHQDGTWVWILGRGKVIHRDAAGKPLLLAGTNTNITKRKLAELALKESEKRYRNLFEASSDAIFILKDNGTIADCNQKTEEILGRGREKIIGRTPGDFSLSRQPDGRTFANQGRRYIASAMHGQPQQFEWLLRHFDGTEFHAEVSLSVMELSGDKVLQTIVRDITERKRAEKSLRESEFRFRSFFNTNPGGIILLDFQGFFLDANKAFLTASGYVATDIVNKHFKDFIPERHHHLLVQTIVELKSGIAQKGPLRISYRDKQGKDIPVAAKGWLVMDEESEPLYLGVFLHDLTTETALAAEKAALEKQVIQAQKSEAIGTLAGGIAHDFNNILGGIIGYTELALYRDPAAVDRKIREYLERVLEGGNRAKDLVQQILRFSRNSNTAMEPIELPPVIKESIRLLRSTLPATIDIKQQITPEHGWILGDPTQMHQVVMNLATNAYHAMRETGGVLSVALENVTLAAPRQFMEMAIPPGEYLRLRIGDTGPGIAQAVLERIFEPYFTTKNVNEGTGLGMAVVLGIVKGHRGLIEIETRLGEGTAFIVYLPLTSNVAAEPGMEEQRLPLGHGERVLIVDDEAFFLEVIEESLKLLGYQVTACHSSLATLKSFKENPAGYDLLITDQTMPEMTGVQLTREIRTISATLPIILCTGYSEIINEASASYYGITGFLMKPVNIHDLAQAIHQVLKPLHAS